MATLEPQAHADAEPEAIAPEPEAAAPEPEAAARSRAEPSSRDRGARARRPSREPAPRARDPSAEPDHVAPAEPTTVAELVAATLRAAGVRIAFTVAGESFLSILDALTAAGIRVVATRHEGAAAFAAEAYGQLTGRPAACLGTRAVGAANLAIGIHTATADSTPMFVIVGGVDRGLRGREAFQEIDLVDTIGGLAKWAGEIDDAETAAATLEAAVRAAVEGRPGPALIAIPEDVQDLALPEGTRAPVVRPHPEAPSAADLRAVLNFLASAERPVILAGAGVLRARCSNDLVRFAELLHVPVIASWRRGDVIPNDHPLFLGMTGFGSPRTVRERIETADALLVLGSRLSEPTTSEFRVPGDGPALDARGPRAPVGTRRLRVRPRAGDPGRRPGLPAGGQRAPEGGRAPRRARRTRATGTTPPTAQPGRRRPSSTAATGAARASIPAGSSRTCTGCCPRTPSSRRMPGRSPAGWRAGSGSGGPARSSDRPRAPWATASRRRSRRRSCTASGASSRSSAMAAWA